LKLSKKGQKMLKRLKKQNTKVFFRYFFTFFQKELVADEQDGDSAPTNNRAHGAVDETLEVIQRGAIGTPFSTIFIANSITFPSFLGEFHIRLTQAKVFFCVLPLL
jgi:hypothetical protein